MKKLLIVLGAVVLIGAIGWVTFNYNYKQMVKYLTGYTLKNIDLNSISDGTYNGNCKSFLVGVALTVKVKNHKIEDISISKQSSGKGYEGRQVIDRVLQNQSLQVDAKTGATGSSKCILIAVEKALTSSK